jgi:hypothetical protein
MLLLLMMMMIGLTCEVQHMRSLVLSKAEVAKVGCLPGSCSKHWAAAMQTNDSLVKED